MKFHNRLCLFLAVTIALISVSGLVAANYIGPDRSYKKTTGQHVLKNPDGTWACSYPCGGTCGLYPSECSSYQCGSLEDDNQCKTVTVNDSPATITGTFTCGVEGQEGWCRGDPEMSFTARDPVTGKKITYVEGTFGGLMNVLCDPVDSSNVSCLWNPVDGFGTLEYWAHSTYGDTTAKATQNLLVDTTAPSVSLAVDPPDGQNGWHVSPVNVWASANDAVSGVAVLQVKIDGGGWQSGTALVTEQGEHTGQASAEDHAGNSSSSITASFKLDSEPPTLVTSISEPEGNDSWYTGDITVSVNGSDSTSGLEAAEVQVDGGGWQSGSATIAADGLHTLIFRTVDVAGNSSNTTTTVQLDRSSPTLDLDLKGTPGQNDWFISMVEATPIFTDSVSGISHSEIKIDSSPWQDAAPFLLESGIHAIQLRAVDRAGNASIKSATVQVDTTEPKVYPGLPKPDGLDDWYITDPQVTVSGSDDPAGIQAAETQLDGTGWKDGPQTVSGDGNHTIEFRVTDRAGNTASQSTSIKIDTTPPESSVVAPESGLVLGDVILNGAASDSLSGLKDVQFSPNCSSNWVDLPVVNGEWTYTWQTLKGLGGENTICVRVTDLAGNENIWKQTYDVLNRAPSIFLTEEWPIWSSGELIVRAGDLPLTTVRLSISDPQARWPAVEMEYGPGSIPAQISWNRRFADRTLAPIGRYEVIVVAVDTARRTAEAHGIIVIPPGIPPAATPSPTIQISPTPTSTFTETPTCTVQPTRTATLIASPTLWVTPSKTVEPAGVLYLHRPRSALWQFLTLLGLSFALGLAAVRDQRPKAWNALANQMKKIQTFLYDTNYQA